MKDDLGAFRRNTPGYRKSKRYFSAGPAERNPQINTSGTSSASFSKFAQSLENARVQAGIHFPSMVPQWGGGALHTR